MWLQINIMYVDFHLGVTVDFGLQSVDALELLLTPKT